jgi:multicomponent Na+:H+ antiporter subunit F
LILAVVEAALLVSMALALIRAMRGPSVFERILAANSFNSMTVLLIAVTGFLMESPPDYLDISLMYAIIGFIGTVAILRCVEYDGFRASSDEEAGP